MNITSFNERSEMNYITLFNEQSEINIMKKIFLFLIVVVLMVSCNVNNDSVQTPLDNFNITIDTLNVRYNAADSTLFYNYENTTKYNILYKDIDITVDNYAGTGKTVTLKNRVFYHSKTKEVYMVIRNVGKLNDVDIYFVTYGWCYTLDEYISLAQAGRVA